MIKLNIETYCEECPEFEAEINKMYANGGVLMTVISCEHANKCRDMVKYLKNKIINGKTKDAYVDEVIQIIKTCSSHTARCVDRDCTTCRATRIVDTILNDQKGEKV